MGLLDVFRPRWKHSNPDVRLQAVKVLDDDQALGEAAARDEDERIRRAAIRQMVDPWRLKNVAHVQSDDRLRSLALARARELFVQIALSGQESERNSLAAVRDLESQEHLAEIALRAPRPAVRRQALDLVVAKGALANLVRRATDRELRLAALARLSDPDTIKHLVCQEKDPSFAGVLLDRLDPAALVFVAERARTKSVAKLARQRVPAATAASAPAVTADLEALKRHARQHQVTREMEALSANAGAGSEEDERKSVDLETEWALVGAEAEVELRVRFEAAARRFRRVHGPAAEARKKAEARQAAQRIAAKMQALAGRMEDEAAPKAVAPSAPAPEPPARQEAPPVKTPEAARPVLRPHELANETTALRALLPHLESALPTDRLRVLNGALKQSRAAGQRLERLLSLPAPQGEEALSPAPDGAAAGAPQTEPVDARSDATALRLTLSGLESSLRARIAEIEQREDWKRWANLQQLELVCRQAEVLREVLPDFPDKSQARVELSNLRAAWRRVGPVPAERKNELWMRFKAACEGVLGIVGDQEGPGRASASQAEDAATPTPSTEEASLGSETSDAPAPEASLAPAPSEGTGDVVQDTTEA
ncbi:MAG: hypothetical protein KA712_24865 [Myxococcales bacterium]|nr:hypothetical protein [Myxococcales bacterium]